MNTFIIVFNGQEFYENGEVIEERSFYENGQLETKFTRDLHEGYYSNGNIDFSYIYKDGVMIEEKYYFFI